ncbi:MAG: ABC transporter substrate-binding protein, partial [Inquilinus sp.]|nr:ABC transporter substrate-binding protein [Inquilinus sp.]
ALVAAGAEVIVLVANAPDGIVALREVAARPPEERLPIISHWGITGGDFHAQAAEAIAAVDLSFLQTFSFIDPPFPDKADRVTRAYCERFDGCTSPADVVSPVGTAHAYDLIHLLRLAIEQAGSADRRRVRDALEDLGRYEGLVRHYDPPFTEARHDALDASDYRLCRYDETGAIIPVPLP